MWIDLDEIGPDDLAFPQVHIEVIKDFLKLNKKAWKRGKQI